MATTESNTFFEDIKDAIKKLRKSTIKLLQEERFTLDRTDSKPQPTVKKKTASNRKPFRS